MGWVCGSSSWWAPGSGTAPLLMGCECTRAATRAEGGCAARATGLAEGERGRRRHIAGRGARRDVACGRSQGPRFDAGRLGDRTGKRADELGVLAARLRDLDGT